MKSLRVGVAQIGVTLGEVDANIETHQKFITQAKSANVDLLLFPELSLSGYLLDELVPRVAMAQDDARLLQLAQVCPDMTVVVGLVLQESPGEYYNAMVGLQGGQVSFVHRKINLPNYGGLSEGRLFKPAKQIELAPLDDSWSMATLICADLWNPGLVYAAMVRWPSLLLAPINSGQGVVSDSFSNPEGWKINLQYYAMTYGTPVIMANRCDQEKGVQFWGGSRILGPKGETLALAGVEQTLIHTEVNLDSIAAARFELPTIRDADPNLVKKLI